MKVRTDLKAGQGVYPEPQQVQRVVNSIVTLAKQQNSLVINWANTMSNQSGQVWQAMTGN